MKALDYDYKTNPYEHQHEVFLLSRDRVDFALLMGMGTGKTKVSIDTGAWLYAKGKIGLMLVIAPNGVHRNWISREVPAHMPEWTRYRAAIWASSMLKAEQKAIDNLWDDGPGLRIVALNVEAFSSGAQGKAAKFVRQLLNAFPTLMLLDESSKIKTPGSKRTKTLISLARHSAFRRILTGTPVTNGPLDIWAQFAFLNKNHLGYDNYFSFKHHFAEWKREINHKTNQQYDSLVSYRNMDELVTLIGALSYRKTKNQCLDLPDKVYERRPVELSKNQAALYKQIRQRSLYELEHGEEITIANVLTKLLRLQQVVGGFIPAEERGAAEPIEGTNPRMEALLDVVEEARSDGKIIIWARFKPELKAVTELLRKEYGYKAVVEYHGSVKKHDREENVDRFQNDPECLIFVGQPHSGGYGLTLTAGKTVIYYSNDFSLEARLQSEDRAHRIGQTNKVTYVDFEAANTIDTKIITAMRAKKNLADVITKDDPTTWL